MHVALDVTALKTGHKNRGIGIYTDLLIKSLKQYKDNFSYSFFVRGQSIPKNVDLVHYPYFEPFFYSLPLVKSAPTIVTVHDLIPIVFKDHFPSGMKGSVIWQLQRVSLRGARAIIADSEWSRRDVVRITGVPSDRVFVTHLAPKDVFTKRPSAKALRNITAKYHVSQSFVLYVGDVNWNKNIPGLLRAFHTIQVRRPEMQLVLVGSAFLESGIPEMQEINNIIRENGLQRAIVKTGHVRDTDLAALYASASVCVQPSFAEGFGLPILEAMASGCPVVCAKRTSLTEISGPAILVNPDEVNDIARGILQVLEFSEEKRAKLRDEGERWAKTFTWRRVAHQTAKIYESVTR